MSGRLPDKVCIIYSFAHKNISGICFPFLIYGLLLFADFALTEDITAYGKVSRFIDGDTVEVRFEQGDVQVRLHAIDTPDMEQAYYAEANAALVNLIGDHQVTLVTATEDRGRLGAVILVDGKDVNAEMIRNGFAYAYRKYLGLVDADAPYCALEHEARIAKRGLWALPAEDRIAPWQIRDYWRGDRTAFTDFSQQTVADCAAAAGKPDADPGTFTFAPTPGLTPPDPDCPIKGSVSFTGKRTFIMPGHRDYRITFIDQDDGERWFCSEDEALQAGWKPAR